MNIAEISEAAEKQVENWLKQYQLQPKRYTRAELRNGRRTPDFRVYQAGVEKFFCEVKSVLPSVKGTGGGSDPIPNRLTDDIHDACKKFIDSNPSHLLPNVLTFVQCDMCSGVDYLEDVYLGHWLMDDGTAYPFYVKYANGRIKEEKTIIDLYLWFGGNSVEFRFTGTHSQHYIELCRLFGRNQRIVPHGI